MILLATPLNCLSQLYLRLAWVQPHEKSGWILVRTRLKRDSLTVSTPAERRRMESAKQFPGSANRGASGLIFFLPLLCFASCMRGAYLANVWRKWHRARAISF